MTSNPFFLLSVLIGPFFAFFVWVFLVKIFIRIFSIKNFRLKATLKLIPFGSLILNYYAKTYSVAYWLNPLSCASCIQKFSLDYLYPHVKEHLLQYKICLIQYLGKSYEHIFFHGLLVTIKLISILLLSIEILRTCYSLFVLKRIIRTSVTCHRSLNNPKLTEVLEKHGIRILVNQDIEVPFASYNKTIVIPQHIVTVFPQEEFEAVIAHEYEHIRCYDPLVRLLYLCTAAVFWWIPTNFWKKQIKQDQEMACDNHALHYGISNQSIASAVVKVIKQMNRCPSFCYFSNKAYPTALRLQSLLGLIAPRQEKIRFALLGIFIAFLLFIPCFAL